MVRIFISLILSLWAGFAYADQTSITIPESQNDFNARYGTSGQVQFGPMARLAINPALKTIASNFAGTSCTGIASPVPWQWCIDTTARTARLNTSDSGGNFAFHDVFTIQSDGSISSAGGSGTVTSVAGRSGAVTLSVADIAGAVSSVAGRTGTVTLTSADVSGVLSQSGNLGDVASVPTARANLGVIPHVATNAALQTFTSYTSPVVRDAYATLGDRGEGTFYHSGTACSGGQNGGTRVTAADGGCWLNNDERVRVEQFGASTGATGATNVTAFNAALATTRDVICDGIYTITDKLIMNGGGALGGLRNRQSCTLSIPSSFNLSATGVVQMCQFGAVEPGGYVHDMSIDFAQPDTATKAALTQYPPALMSDTDLVYPSTGSVCARWRAERIRIDKAWTAIDMRGNSGGVVMDKIEMSAFDKGIRMDGVFDVTTISNFEWWGFGGPATFGMTSNQLSIFWSSSVAMEIGRADGVMLSNSIFLGGVGMNFITSTRSSGGAWVMMSGGGFDTHSGISMLVDSTFQGNGIYFTPSGFTSDYAINQSNGRILLANSTVFSVVPTTNAPIRISGGKFESVSGWFDTGAVDKSTIVQSDGFMQLGSNSFQRTGSTAYTTATVYLSVVNARASIIGNRIEDRGGAACTSLCSFITVTADNYNRIIGNVGVGWPSTFPTAVNGVYQFN